MNTIDQCMNCLFYDGDRQADAVKGVCRRFPPAREATKHYHDIDGWQFPIVDPCDWCGEFKWADDKQPIDHT
jgi:hypothetical protein